MNMTIKEFKALYGDGSKPFYLSENNVAKIGGASVSFCTPISFTTACRYRNKCRIVVMDYNDFRSDLPDRYKRTPGPGVCVFMVV